jgi:hypothetical protein
MVFISSLNVAGGFDDVGEMFLGVDRWDPDAVC